MHIPRLGPRRTGPPGLDLLRRHVLITVLVAVAGALRVLATVAYRPAFEFSGDSYAYLRLARPLVADPVRPAGYPLLLRALSVTGRLWVVPAVQHATGIALGLAVYALMVHRGVTRPVAALAAAPVLLDAYQVDIEHFVMAETLFEALLVAGMVALLWNPRPSPWACGFAGACLALASLVRTVGVVLGMLALLHVLVRRPGWSRSIVFVGALAVPLLGYASWFHSAHGTYALTGGDTYWLYGRVAPIADCARLDLTPVARQLCSPHPPRERPGPNYYVWNHNSPRFTISVPDGDREAVLADFSHQVIRHQPVDYARMVAGEVAHYFAPGRQVGARDWYVGTWQFPAEVVPAYWHDNAPLMTFDGEQVARHISPGPAAFLRAYQRHGFAPGPALGAMAVLGAVAVLPGRRRPREPVADRRCESRRLRADCALLVAAGMALLVIPSATVCFDYRYLLPTLVLFPPAAALGWHRATLGRTTRRSGLSAQRTGTPAGRRRTSADPRLPQLPTAGRKDSYDHVVDNPTCTPPSCPPGTPASGGTA